MGACRRRLTHRPASPLRCPPPRTTWALQAVAPPSRCLAASSVNPLIARLAGDFGHRIILPMFSSLAEMMAPFRVLCKFGLPHRSPIAKMLGCGSLAEGYFNFSQALVAADGCGYLRRGQAPPTLWAAPGRGIRRWCLGSGLSSLPTSFDYNSAAAAAAFSSASTLPP